MTTSSHTLFVWPTNPKLHIWENGNGKMSNTPISQRTKASLVFVTPKVQLRHDCCAGGASADNRAWRASCITGGREFWGIVGQSTGIPVWWAARVSWHTSVSVRNVRFVRVTLRPYLNAWADNESRQSSEMASDLRKPSLSGGREARIRPVPLAPLLPHHLPLAMRFSSH